MRKPKNKNLWDLTVKGSYSVSELDGDTVQTLHPLASDPSIWAKEIENPYEKWNWELTPQCTDAYGKRIDNKHLESAEEVLSRWDGALVRFGPYLFGRGINIYDPPNFSAYKPLYQPENTSRIDKLEADYAQHTGTVFEVDKAPNYKGGWCVYVLWSDGMVSYENIQDLEIIQPGTD